MDDLKKKTVPFGNGRRLDIERRQFSYTRHIPERRSGKDRRRVSEATQSLNARPVIKTGNVLAA